MSGHVGSRDGSQFRVIYRGSLRVAKKKNSSVQGWSVCCSPRDSSPIESLTMPLNSTPRYSDLYTIYVYQRLGGHVIRYQLRIGAGREVQIQQKTIARWVGDCWGIM